MKSTITMVIICLLGTFTACQSQGKNDSFKITKEKEPVLADTTKQMNLLDAQTKMFNQVFTLAGADEDNPLGGSTNYIELIEKMEVPQEQKQQIREIYDLYDTSLDPKKKEELKVKVNKMVQKAIDRTQSDIEQ